MKWWLWACLTLVSCTAWFEPCKPGHICSEMGTGELGFNGDGLLAHETRLASPTAVTTGPGGEIVVTDYSNMLIRRLTEEGTIEVIAGNGIHAYSEVGTNILDSPLENPIEAKWGPDGRLYILPQHEGRLIAVEDTGQIALVAGTGAIADSGDGGDALDAEMGYGGGFAFGPDGAIYISDSTYSRVRRVNVNGTIDTVLGIGKAGDNGVGYGPETAIRFPERVAVDANGNRLLVVDSMNHRVLAVDLDSLETTILAGTGEPGYSGDDGPAASAELNAPVGVESAPDGGVYRGLAKPRYPVRHPRWRHLDHRRNRRSRQDARCCPRALLSDEPACRARLDRERRFTDCGALWTSGTPNGGGIGCALSSDSYAC